MDQQKRALEQARHRVAQLSDALARNEGQPVEWVETHISWVLLASEFAYKFKKPLRLAFLDSTTLEARRRYCDEELRVNRRLAQALYLQVMAVHESSNGASFEGDGPVVDFAVKMRRFPTGALWSERIACGRLCADDVDQFGRTLAMFHRDAPVAPTSAHFGRAEQHARTTRGLIAGIDTWLATPGAGEHLQADWASLQAWLLRQLAILQPAWEARRLQGRVRECHGDLHLANVLQLERTSTAFDAIEFDPALRWIDVIDDAAFLVMDLMAHGATALAWRFLNGYLEAGGDYDGLVILRFSLVCRALVRAQVALMKAAQGGDTSCARGPRDYFALAVRLALQADPRMAITCGLPGSGKSTVARQLVEAAGALRARSDVERKRLHGLQPLDDSRAHIEGGIYDSVSTQRTYARLLEIARLALDGGWRIIVDAAFLKRPERAAFAELARSRHRPFTVLLCQGSPAQLRQRLQQRQAAGTDPSEADVEVFDRLSDVLDLLDDQERLSSFVVDAACPPDATELARNWEHVPSPSWWCP